MLRARRTRVLVAAAGLGLAAVAAWLAATGRVREPDTTRGRPGDASGGASRGRARVADATEPDVAPSPAGAGAAWSPPRSLRSGGARRVLFAAGAERIAGAPGAWTRALLASVRESLALDTADGAWVETGERTTLSGRHLRLAQTVRGVRVEGGEVGVHVAADGRPLLVRVDAYAVGDAETEPRVAADAAVASARDVLTEDADGDPAFDARPPVLLLRPGAAPDGRSVRLVWRVDAEADGEPSRVVVDALDGEVLSVGSLAAAADAEVTGVARVFRPNPVHSARNAAFRDRRDRTGAALAAELSEVDLPRLDGSGFPRGRWCDTTFLSLDPEEPSLDWRSLTRSDEAFESVSAYYHVDRVQDHLQSLGIVDANASRQMVQPRAFDSDRSYYSVLSDLVRLGLGGVDDAEDGDVVVHEYGHAIQFDQVPEFGLEGESGAMGEGFGDFLACAMHTLGREPDDVWDPRVASWDATSYSRALIPYLRRVDGSKRYPRHVVDEPHADGEIWSRFLWDLYRLVGHDDALRVVIESHTFLRGGDSFRDGADAVLVANLSLREGRDDDAIRGFLRDRGLPFTRPPADAPPEDAYEENDGPGDAKALETGEHPDLLLADEDWFVVNVPPYRRVAATASFDPLDLDLGLELRTTDGRVVAAAARTAQGSAAVTAAAGGDGATFLVRAFPAGSSRVSDGYALAVADTELQEARLGRRSLRRGLDGISDAVAVPVDAEKAERATTLVVVCVARPGGAVNDVRVVAPSGEVVADFGGGRTARGARVAVPLTEAGSWIVELRPRRGTSGASVLRVRAR